MEKALVLIIFVSLLFLCIGAQMISTQQNNSLPKSLDNYYQQR